MPKTGSFIKRKTEGEYIVKLKDRVTIITEENMNKLIHLYGEIDFDDLSRIVNNHLKIAIDEIEEDSMRKKRRNLDLIQMNTDIVLTDKDGKFINVKVPEPEYITDPMW